MASTVLTLALIWGWSQLQLLPAPCYLPSFCPTLTTSSFFFSLPPTTSTLPSGSGMASAPQSTLLLLPQLLQQLWQLEPSDLPPLQHLHGWAWARPTMCPIPLAGMGSEPEVKQQGCAGGQRLQGGAGTRPNGGGNQWQGAKYVWRGADAGIT